MLMTRSNSGRLPGLDTLRSIAIVAVMLYHLKPFLPESMAVVAQFGWMGVDLFFVLSGYLIGLQLLKPYASGGRPSIWSFYRRRAYRILPAYLVVLWIYLVFPAWRESSVLPPLWQFLTFTVNLFFVDFSQHAFSHVWSLCVEEHFYLVLPLLVMGDAETIFAKDRICDRRRHSVWDLLSRLQAVASDCAVGMEWTRGAG
jgi:peptidoglycan/LPS O-acetylase OafA/YrhL